jgi:ABC-type cobalamin/Fe3+-siderophores transport system ATPase subunit
VLALKDGRVVADGKPQEVLTENALTDLYNIGVALRTVEYGGRTVKISLPVADT